MRSNPARAFPRMMLRLGGLLALAPAIVIAAAPSPQAAVATRQNNYKEMGRAMKALNDQLKSDAPDRATMVAASRILSATARLQGGLFPPGSGPSAGLRTDALPAVWTDRPAFDAAMARMVGETGKLAAATASGDIAAIRLQAKATGATCGACHRQFRADG